MSDEARLLRELLVEIRALRGDLRALAGRDRPCRSSVTEDQLRPLLAVIHGAVGGRAFTQAQLREHASLPVQPAIDLRHALTKIGARRLGQLLHHASVRGIDGFVVAAVEPTRAGMRWKVARAASAPASLPHVLRSGRGSR